MYCIQACQSSAASETGEPNTGGGDEGGGGEGGRLLRTEAIEGARDGDHEAVRSRWAAIFSCTCSNFHTWCKRARAAAGAGSTGSTGSGVEVSKV